MNPLLTVIVIDPVELDVKYLRLYFQSLINWNLTMLNDVEFVVMTQKRLVDEFVWLLSEEMTNLTIMLVKHDWVGDYPVWDVVAELKQAWPYVHGKYVTVHHPEFIWHDGTLSRTLNWLNEKRPYMAMGNLRRIGSMKDAKSFSKEQCIKEMSDELFSLMGNGYWLQAERLIAIMETTTWMYWFKEQRPGLATYMEDVFFADREWLDSWKWLDHGGRLPFQDIWDLMYVAMCTEFEKHKIAPAFVRMPRNVGEMIHLWHKKQWGSWTLEMRNYFLSDRERWQGTSFLNEELWNKLISIEDSVSLANRPVGALRNGVGGTVMRYGAALSEWLQSGGAEQVKQHYKMRIEESVTE